MDQPNPIPEPSPTGESNKGDIIINEKITGKVIIIGHGNQLQLTVSGVQDEILHLNPDDSLPRELMQMVADGKQLISDGLLPDIAPLCFSPEDLRPEDAFRSPLGTLVPLAANTQQPANSFTELSDFLNRLEERFGGTIIDLSDGKQNLSIGDLLLQKGNLALLRFRRGALPLFAEQAGLYALAKPQDLQRPELVNFQMAASSQPDILRSWMLFLKYQNSEFDQFYPATFTLLQQGQWQEVLQQWEHGKKLTSEQIQAERSYLLALGEHFESQRTLEAAKEAELYYQEALRRQPTCSTALINLGALLAERALLTYIETGTVDHACSQQARDYFQQAHKLLDQHPDPQSQAALLHCLIYERISFPPATSPEIIAWVDQQTRQLHNALQPGRSNSVRWDVVQRNLTWRHSFAHHLKFILLVAGGGTALGLLGDLGLSTYTHLLNWPQAPATGLHPFSSFTNSVSPGAINPSAQPVHSVPGASQPGPSNVAPRPSAQPVHYVPGASQPGPSPIHNMPPIHAHPPLHYVPPIHTSPAHPVSHGITSWISHLLSTMIGKVVAATLAMTIIGSTIVGGSLAVVSLANRASGVPPDDASFGLNVTIQAPGVADGTQLVLDITGYPDGGTVCSPGDDGQPLPFSGTSSDTGTPYTGTLTTTCNGTYQAGQISYTETLSTANVTLQSNGNSANCTEDNHAAVLQLTGSYAGNHTFSGTVNHPYDPFACDQSGARFALEAFQGTWTGTVVTQ